MKQTVAVTGGNGFIGKKIIQKLLEKDYIVISLQRSPEHTKGVEVRHFDLSNNKSIRNELFLDVDVVIHTAALVHQVNADEKAHHALNFLATKRLFESCEEAEVNKFIFLSTVGVYGVNCSKTVINVDAQTCPTSPYAVAKLESEKILLSSRSSTVASIIRLPLVYGRGAPGSLKMLEKLAKMDIPLPFLNTNNQRSMVSVDRVAEVVECAVADKESYSGLQLLVEQKSVSTKEIITEMRRERGRSPLLFPVPKILMKLFLTALGKRKMYEQLYEDLEFVSTI